MRRRAKFLIFICGCAVAILATTASAWQVPLSSGHQAGVDPAGDVIVSGVKFNGQADTYAVTKLAGTNGGIVWQQTYAGGRSHGGGGTNEIHGYVYASQIDAAGDVVVVGKLGPDSAEWRALKLHGTDGSEAWRWIAPDWMIDAAVDGAGNVTASGKTDDGNLWVAKIESATGVQQWVSEIQCNFHVICGYLNAVTFDAAGDVVGVGYFLTEEPGSLCYVHCETGYCQVPCAAGLIVAKFRGSDGAELWRKVFIGSARDTWMASPGNAVAVDANGDVIAAGFVRNTGSQADMFVTKLRGSDGASLWSWQTDGGGNDNETVGALVIDAAGDIIISGDLVHAPGDKALAVAKLASASGAEIWRREVSGDVVYPLSPVVLSSFGRPSLALDGNGDILATGAAFHAATQRDWVIARLANGDGSEQWRHVIDGTSEHPRYPHHDDDRGRFVGTDPTGAVIAAGYVDNGASDDSDVPGVTSFTVVKLAGEPISGRKILVRDVEGVPERRKLQAESSDAALFAPVPGSEEDPVLHGASLTLFNPASGETDTYDLPAQGWKLMGAPGRVRGYKYDDRSQASGPCKKVKLQVGKRSARLKVVCGGERIRFTLDEPAQGRLGVRVTFGAGARSHAMVFGGEVQVDAGVVAGRRSASDTSGVGWFKAQKAPATVQ